MKKEILKVDVNCSHCEQGIKTLLTPVAGVTEVEVNLENKTATILFEEKQITLEVIKEMLNDAGY